MITIDDILNDVRAEYERLDTILASLSLDDWSAASGAPGWTIRDVVVHLAETEELVEKSIVAAATENPVWTERAGTLDDAVAARVAQDTSDAPTVLGRWRAAAASSIAALANADPMIKVNWAAAPLRPSTLATTRLAEHWAHGLDITEPLGIEFPDTRRLRHIAWLGYSTIPYGCSLKGLEPAPVRVVLTSPDADTWTFGPEDAPSTIEGSASDFCRVGAQRLPPAASSLHTTGPFADAALSVLRNYAA